MLKLRQILLLLLAIIVFAQNPEPFPTCTALPGLADIPISLQETQVYNMDEYFKGFNLNMKLGNNTPDFVQLRTKFTEKVDFKLDQTGIKNYHFEQIDNGWGSLFITTSQTNFSTTIRWGKLASTDAAPVIRGTVVVQSEQNVFCYDAVIFGEENIAIVDCALRSGVGTYVYYNRFYYVDLAKQEVLPGFVRNQLYVPYSAITQRTFVKYTEDGYHYLMRVYFAEGIDTRYRNNTYLEIFSANNPRKPYILRIIDRSFLGLDRLSIVDFELYLGDMYILDYHQGLIKFDITPAQQIVIAGRYRTDSGFLKFGIFSSNLANEFLLVLANRHAVYEIDWTDQIRPRIITKYSILADSIVNSVAVNHKYVIVQAEGNVTKSNNATVLYNMTWIFSRNSRLYTNAYAIINHDSDATFIDFNRDESVVLSIDQQSISLYAIDTPYLRIFPNSSDLLNQEYIINVVGLSINPLNNYIATCQYNFRMFVVRPENYSTWPTGLTLPKEYYSNYPGELFISLDRYVFGPNITWGIQQESVVGELPPYWILQQNTTRLNWDKFPQANITLLVQQQYDSIQETDLYIYMQDDKYELYVAQCTTEEFRINVDCSVVLIRDIAGPIANLTANRFHYYQGRYLHLVAIVLQKDPNTVVINNVQNGKLFFNLNVADGFEGRITSIEFVHQFFVAVLRFAKTIVVWDMVRCQDYGQCVPIYKITASTLKALGVRYFAPLQVYASDYHKNVLFIQSTDSVIILEFTRNGPILIDQISSPGTNQPGYWGWQMAISQDHLLIINAPDIIQEHSLLEMESKKTSFNKRYPLYNYVLPENFDVDFSDAGNLFYFTAIDKDTNLGVVLVYRAGFPGVSSFYDVFPLSGKYQDVIVQVTGTFADYITVVKKTPTGSTINMFRQYQVPILVFQDTFFDFDFNITYGNSKTGNKNFLSKSKVKIANYPAEIVINEPKLKDTNFLNSLLNYKNDEQKYIINDHQWFNGTVTNYTIKCQSECGNGGKIELVNHVAEVQDVLGSLGMNDVQLIYSSQTFLIQQFQSIMKINHNGSIEEFLTLPNPLIGMNCRKITVDFQGQFIISGCINDNEVYLYLTTDTAYKPFTIGPQISSAGNVDRLIFEGELLFLADIDMEPHYFQRPGGIIVYSLNINPDQGEVFDDLQVIDSNDFTGIKNWDEDDAYLGGLYVDYYRQQNIYRIFTTQLRYGLFIIDFKWARGRSEINILKTNFLNLKDILATNSLPIPNHATFQGIAVLNSTYDKSLLQWSVDIVVSVRNFHNFQLNIKLDRSGELFSSHINAMYYRYIFYESTTYMKSFDGYFIVSQTLPDVFDGFSMYTPQIMAVYDTRPNRTQYENSVQYTLGGIPAFHMLGGINIRDKFHTSFSFNFTLRRNETDPFSKIGVLMVDPRGQLIRQIALSESLHIITHHGIKHTQNVKLTANNDFSHVALPITIHIHGMVGNLPAWAVALIVIGSVAFAGGLGFLGWFLWKKKRTAEELSKSLLEKQAETGQGQEEDEQQGDQEQGQQQEGQEDEQEQDEVKQGEQKTEVKGTEVTNDQQGKAVEPENKKSTENSTQPISREGAVNESIALSEKQ